MKPDFRSYLASWQAEFMTRSMRVRSLIGERHWLSDGMYKEALVREFLTKYLEPGILIGRGFIKPGPADEWPSNEIDVLLADPAAHAPYFWEGGLLITPPSGVLGHIEVKSTLSTQSLKEAIARQDAIQRTLGPRAASVWRGLFFFGPSSKRSLDDVANGLRDGISSVPYRDMACLPTAICVLGECVAFFSSSTGSPTRLRVFRSDGLDAACFFADLLSTVRRGPAGEVSALDELIEQVAGGAVAVRTLPGGTV